MKRASLALCAVGGFVLLLVGCNSLNLGFDLGLSGGDAAGGVRIMDGSPKTVAVVLEGTLKRQGFEAKVVDTGDTVFVDCKTVAGLRFRMLLKSQRAGDGHEQTQVVVEWLDRADQQIGVQIFSEIDRQAKK